MSVFDMIVGGLLIFGVVRGFFRGLIIELASLLAVVLGIYGSIHFSFYVGEFLRQKFQWDSYRVEITAFLITFFLIILGVMLLGKILTKIIQFAQLGFLNRILGAVVACLKVALVLGSFLMVGNQLQYTDRWFSQETQQDTFFYQPMQDLAQFVYAHTWDKYKSFLPSQKKTSNDKESKEITK